MSYIDMTQLQTHNCISSSQFLYVWGWGGKVSIVLESIVPSFYDLRNTGYLHFYQISTVVIFFTVYPSRHQEMKHSPL